MADILHAFGVNWKLLTIQLVNFGLLLILLHRFLYKPLYRVMDERRTKLKQSLDDAEAVAKERIALAEEKKTVLRDARAEGDRLITAARTGASVESRETVQNAEERAVKIVADAEKLGERRKEEIVNESKEELARLAVKAAENILRSHA